MQTLYVRLPLVDGAYAVEDFVQNNYNTKFANTTII